MASNDLSASTTDAPRQRGRALEWAVMWLALLALLAFGGWKLSVWWQSNMQTGKSVATPNDAAIVDLAAAVSSLSREQRSLAQRITDANASDQVLRDEVLGVGERAALLEQSVARIGSPRAQGQESLRLDEAELLLTIGEQQLVLSSDVGNALHAYALADATLAGSTDPSALNLRQSLAQEVAAMRALPPDPRASVAGRLDAFEATLATLPLAAAVPLPAARTSVLDRVLGSMVQVRHTQGQDLLDPATREAALTAIRLELTLARLALERRDETAFRTTLGRIDHGLPRLYAPAIVSRQRQLLADLRQAPLRIDLPILGGTLDELRRLRQMQPDLTTPAGSVPAPTAAATPAAPAAAQAGKPTTATPAISTPTTAASTKPAPTPARHP
ncbi:MAG TPA: uroporphyrinogen-III C-methyltransferase [Xanthomonadaceae bacterium]|jgi:uroporphyrin-3 C-methyltransferase|nr:uroporphyrinogen-III C-methyltransferase [Xanthomonadaceae bacterium]